MKKLIAAIFAVMLCIPYAGAIIKQPQSGTGGGGSTAFSSLTAGTCAGCGTFTMGTGTTLATTGTSVPVLSPTMTAGTNQDGLDLFTPGVASSGNNFDSPSIHLRSEWWSGSASVPTDWLIYGVPSSASAAFLVFATSINGGAYQTNTSITPSGVMNASGFSAAGGVAPAGCANCLYLQTTNNPAISANGAEVMGFTSVTNTSLVPLALPHYTVASLPTCSGTVNTYANAVVTDAATPTYLGTLTGSSTTVVRVLCNGTAWVAD